MGVVISFDEFKLRRYVKIVKKFVGIYLKDGADVGAKYIASQKIPEQDFVGVRELIVDEFSSRGHKVKF